jgi:NADH:ubiquinone oxidoreductase subunit E
MSENEFSKRAIFVCNGSKCGKHKEVKKYFKEAIKEYSLKKEVEIIKMECTGRCKSAPVVYETIENHWIEKATISQLQKLIQKLLEQKKLL